MIRRLLINQKDREKIIIIENGKEILHHEILNKALALQALLSQKKRENVAIMLPNSGDYIAAFWGTIASGMTAFPLNALMTGHEIAPLLKLAGVRTVISSVLYRRLFDEITTLESLSINIVYMEELKPSSHDSFYAEADLDPKEPMVLLSTSGTTGKCKIVQLSENNVMASVLGYLDKMCIEETEQRETRFILAVPFSSAYGMMILSACLLRAIPIVLFEDAFTLDAFYRIAEKHKVTHYEGSASAILLMERMIGRPIPYDISTLTYFGFGGSKVSGETIEKLQGAYRDAEFFQGYGMTETAPLIAKHPRRKVIKTASVGTAIHGVEIVVEVNDEIIRTPYIKGEVVVRGPNVMLGYYNNEADTKQVLRNGYLYTGDIGYLDDEGYLFICGRKKNMIIVRGFNVYPEEVEECIHNSLLTKDCIVYGETDDYGNETVRADIVPLHPLVQIDDIRIYCRLHLAEYKQPIRICFCESIRKSISGKIERKNEALS